MQLKYIVKETDNYTDINEILNTIFNISSRLRVKLINNKSVTLNGTFVDTRTHIKPHDIICVDLSYEEDNSNIVPTKMELDILFEDEWFLVINKPSGISIHPSLLHYSDSLSNGVKYYFDQIGLKKKIRPVNRLDTNTSGLVIFAKCEYIQECFIKQMADKTLKKTYFCLVQGNFEKDTTPNKNINFNTEYKTIDLPIARKPGSIIERCVDTSGQKAITHYRVIKEFDGYSLVECLLETGRTHQIRVHMSYIGHPLLGDDLYNSTMNFSNSTEVQKTKFHKKSNNLMNRQALHSYKIELIHPVTNELLSFCCELPKDMKCLVGDVSDATFINH